MNIKWKLISLMPVLWLALWPATVHAQPGFDRINNYCNYTLESRHRVVFADSQRIIFAGVAKSDSFINACGGHVTYIGAYNYQGNQLWYKQLNFYSPIFKGNEVNSNNTLTKIAPNKYALTLSGYQCDSIYSYSHAAIFIFNENGDSLAFYEVPPSVYTEFYAPYAIKADRQNNILIAGGYISHPNSDSISSWLAKFKSNGQFLWKKKLTGGDYAETYTSIATKIVVGNQANEYLISGKKLYLDTALHKTENAIWKTDTAGNVLWQRNLPKFPDWGPQFTDDGLLVFDIINASNGSGYYFAATAPIRYRYPQTSEDGSRGVYYCGKLNEEGHVLWAKTYEIDTVRSDAALGIVQQKNGDLLIIGSSADILPSPDNSGASLLCIDSLGHAKWSKIRQHYNCTNIQPEQTFSSISIAPNGGIVRAGGISQNDPQLGCWDTVGTIAWLAYTDSLGRLNPNDTITYPLHESEVDYDPTGIVYTSKGNTNFNIYPNPMKDKIRIEIQGFDKSTKGLNAYIYDYTGKIILVQEITSLSTQINLSPFPSGVYLIRLAGNESDMGVRKVVKQ